MVYDGFTFTALNDMRLASATSKKTGFESDGPGGPEQLARDQAHFRGALLQLFGSPLRTSGLSDEAFDYVIEARNALGMTWILTAYQGASGSAIGGKIFDETVGPAVLALVRLIGATTPADFEAIVYDEDTNNTAVEGIKDGQYFYFERAGKLGSGQTK